jgi:hypothetical protein
LGRSPFSLSAVLGLLVLCGGAGTVVVVGCGGSGAAEFGDDGVNEPTSPLENSEDPTFGGTDASPRPASVVRGSPLCRVTDDKCDPDDDGLPKNTTDPPPNPSNPPPNPTTAICGAPDAGGGGTTSSGGISDASTIANACRVGKVNDGYSPLNCQLADRNGSDGVACQRGADCAPGFECVDSDKGGVCRRYCCSGSCGDYTSQNGGATFCDVQLGLDINPHKAPVCMPLKKCKLLRAGECVNTETCAVVTEKGDTGCVVKGDVKAGESCDDDHCAGDLTCLGTPGDRRCYKLCRIDGSGPECRTNERCATSAAFQDTSFGVCKVLPQAR